MNIRKSVKNWDQTICMIRNKFLIGSVNSDPRSVLYDFLTNFLERYFRVRVPWHEIMEKLQLNLWLSIWKTNAAAISTPTGRSNFHPLLFKAGVFIS